ncbi:MAG: aspartate kinase [Bacteroidales bacterium]|nr:aspartate kinase [Bacteroidales bacterium]
MSVQVFKFGGASVKDGSSVRNVLKILQRQSFAKLVLVISAMGKTTNNLEQLFYAYIEQRSLEPHFEKVYAYHHAIVEELFGSDKTLRIFTELEKLFIQLRSELQVFYDGNFNKAYDRIVHYGELFSSTILYWFLLKSGLNVALVSARDCILTDCAYREANVLWDKTCEAIRYFALNAFEKHDIIISQGFIGSSEDGEPATLGREGSDYTAAIFAYALDATSLTIWKDVPGVMNADPKRLPDAVPVPHLSYKETVELAYYGASVIHPKTLKPLQNKKIPLFVRSFIDSDLPGTSIDDREESLKLPFYIIKPQQVLMSFFPKDFSFIDESNLSLIFSILARHQIKIRLMENTALSFSVCFDEDPYKIDFILQELSVPFYIKYNTSMELITIRHHQFAENIEKLVGGRKVYLEQRTRIMRHLLVKSE